MIRSLFHLRNISQQDLADFLFLDEPESEWLDYKQELNDSVVETIAAMANTNGGIIIIGVSERKNGNEHTDRPDQIVGVSRRDLGRLVNKCYTLLDPSRFLPELLEVSLAGQEEIVIVVRIDPDRVPVRPIIFRKHQSGRVYVRHEDSNREADPITLRRVFSESSSPPTHRSGPSAYIPEIDRNRENVAFLVRLGYAEQRHPAVQTLTSDERYTIQAWLKNSPLCCWMDTAILGTDTYLWKIEESWSNLLRFTYRPPSWESSPIWIEMFLDCSGMAYLDVIFGQKTSTPPALDSSFGSILKRVERFPVVSWREIYQATIAGLATLVHPNLLKFNVGPGWSPRFVAWLQSPVASSRSLDESVQKDDSWPRSKPHLMSEDRFEAPWEGNDLGALNEIMRAWWTKHLGNLGYLGFEADLRAIEPDRLIKDAWDNQTETTVVHQ